jgi:hypothetical protein
VQTKLEVIANIRDEVSPRTKAVVAHPMPRDFLRRSLFSSEKLPATYGSITNIVRRCTKEGGSRKREGYFNRSSYRGSLRPQRCAGEQGGLDSDERFECFQVGFHDLLATIMCSNLEEYT